MSNLSPELRHPRQRHRLYGHSLMRAKVQAPINKDFEAVDPRDEFNVYLTSPLQNVDDVVGWWGKCGSEAQTHEFQAPSRFSAGRDRDFDQVLSRFSQDTHRDSYVKRSTSAHRRVGRRASQSRDSDQRTDAWRCVAISARRLGALDIALELVLVILSTPSLGNLNWPAFLTYQSRKTTVRSALRTQRMFLVSRS
ncbi:hypothetical protein DFH09DRAFT_1089188 [Mycena vulgaris]|nr:hypothetical protein DFH09DRAFT_1089188 [Mycena vulgaris]